jgi:PhnB protein
MTQIVAYLNFDGKCREAMTFYQKCLGAELQLMPFSDMPGGKIPPEAKDRIMHARLTKGTAILMASDSLPGMPFQQGNNFWVSVDCESVEEVERLFNSLVEGGTVRMALQTTFWAARFGMLTDRFGVNWMFNVEQPKQG